MDQDSQCDHGWCGLRQSSNPWGTASERLWGLYCAISQSSSNERDFFEKTAHVRSLLQNHSHSWFDTSRRRKFNTLQRQKAVRRASEGREGLSQQAGQEALMRNRRIFSLIIRMVCWYWCARLLRYCSPAPAASAERTFRHPLPANHPKTSAAGSPGPISRCEAFRRTGVVRIDSSNRSTATCRRCPTAGQRIRSEMSPPGIVYTLGHPITDYQISPRNLEVDRTRVRDLIEDAMMPPSRMWTSPNWPLSPFCWGPGGRVLAWSGCAVIRECWDGPRTKSVRPGAARSSREVWRFFATTRTPAPCSTTSLTSWWG